VTLDDIEWPDTDLEVTARVSVAHRSERTGFTFVEQLKYSRYKKWSLTKKVLWWFSFLLSLLWAAIFGVVGLLLCITIVLAPLGLVLMLAAGAPSTALIGKVIECRSLK